MRKILFASIFFSIFGVSKMAAQITETYQDTWFLLLNNYQLNDKINLGNEVHWRMTNVLSDNQQFLFRPYITYRNNETIASTFGYTYILSYPYGNSTREIPRPEHNVWEQFELFHGQNKWKFIHRFRLENRFSGQYDSNASGEEIINGFSFSNRFRYRITLKRDLSEKWFFHGFNEVWVKTNNTFQNPSYDRNWIYLGFGYRFVTSGNIQLAYMRQNINAGVDAFEIHPTIQMTLQYDFDFTGKSAEGE